MIDFRAMAKERAGKRWSRLDDPKRRALIRAEKVAWLTQRTAQGEKREGYADWLRAQPAEVQDVALGPTRAKLFREGKLAVEKFVDPRGRPLTLQELAATRPESFTRAGLDPADFNKGR